MSNRERVRQLKILRATALGIGTRALKLRLNKLARRDPLARAARLALEIEDANICAKRYGLSKWAGMNYERKQRLIGELIGLFRRHGWEFGYRPAEYGRGVIYFDLPGCEQISWHYEPQEELPAYNNEWDGKTNSTLPKLLDFIKRKFKGITR